MRCALRGSVCEKATQNGKRELRGEGGNCCRILTARVSKEGNKGIKCAVKSSQKLLSGIYGASAKQGPWGQSVERAGCGLHAVL